ncbi:Uncharacterized membrane protein YhhN [Clostridium amylolyticum]|uniref:Uncharacterized membrane protein YhhN n=1 Tax=Clostridium amylolyticum TaxID=1121298 RepID=A0A1M6CRY7_9CLOT|nr:lysoplasmalogenase [Clostridium amylolyticum]SHI63787.1 Uncharacterized membrane protein YhhN [Clostridium amylolyticum]
MYNTFILIAFITVSILNIIFNYRNNLKGIYLTKPLIMPLLILYYITLTQNINFIIIGALIFGFLGDIFLLDSKNHFTKGLLSFFCGHILYIVAFYLNFTIRGVKGFYFVFIIFYLFYALLLVKGLFPYLGSMKILGTMYMSTIMVMSFISLLMMLQSFTINTVLIFLGSIIFIISDSVLAFDTFKEKYAYSGVIIMSTYITAQFLIIVGIR